MDGQETDAHSFRIITWVSSERQGDRPRDEKGTISKVDIFSKRRWNTKDNLRI